MRNHSHSILGKHVPGSNSGEPVDFGITHSQWGRDRQDVWILRLFQMGDAEFRDEESASRVDRHREVELLSGSIFNWQLIDSRSIVDADVDSAEFFDGGLDGSFNTLFISDVALDWKAFASSLSDIFGCGVNSSF